MMDAHAHRGKTMYRYREKVSPANKGERPQRPDLPIPASWASTFQNHEKLTLCNLNHCDSLLWQL